MLPLIWRWKLNTGLVLANSNILICALPAFHWDAGIRKFDHINPTLATVKVHIDYKILLIEALNVLVPPCAWCDASAWSWHISIARLLSPSRPIWFILIYEFLYLWLTFCCYELSHMDTRNICISKIRLYPSLSLASVKKCHLDTEDL